jgi:hypothetical protein
MNYIAIKHKYLSSQPSDINEHLPTILEYVKQSASALVLAGTSVQPYWTFTHGLINNNQEKKVLYYNTPAAIDKDEFTNVIRHLKNLSITFSGDDYLVYDLPENTTVDLTFIDSWHVYGCMKRELERFAPKTNKYIVMHDTTVDEWEGETIRCNLDVAEQMQRTGLPSYEIKRGVWPAIQEFLNDNPQWKLKERFTNNNGLTILEKVQP